MPETNKPNPAAGQPQPSPKTEEALNGLERLINLSRKNEDIIAEINKLKGEGAEIDSESYDLSRKTTAELSKHQEIYSNLNNLVKRLNGEAEKAASDARKANAASLTASIALEKADKEKKEASATEDVALDKSKKAQEELARRRSIERIKSYEDLQAAYLKKINELEKINAADRTQAQNEELARTKDLNDQNQKKLDLATSNVRSYQLAADEALREYNAAKAITEEKQKQVETTNAIKLAADAAASAANAAAKEAEAEAQKYREELEITKQLISGLRQKKKAMDSIDELLGSHIWQYKNIKTLIMGSAKSVDYWVSMFKISVDVLKQFLDRFKEVDAAAGKFREKTGITTSQMKTSTRDMNEEFRSINVELARFGVGMEEVVESGAAFAGEFQVVGLVTKEATRNAAMLAANLGISVTDTAKLSSLFTKIVGDSKMTMEELTGAAAKLAEMGGVAPNLVLKDMAEASEQTLTFLAKNPIELVRATVEARRLGTTINALSKTARGLLNFQESITAELEASAMIGKSLNFQEARLLAFQGKIVESRQSAMKQLEQIGDFTSLNLYQQEAIARAMNMTVDEIIKQQNQEKMLAEFRKNATGDDLKQLQEYDELQKKIADNEKDATKNLVNQGREFVKNANRQTQINQLTDAFKSMWTSLVDAAMPFVESVLIPIVNLVQKIAKEISEWPDGLKKTLAIGAAVLAVIAAIASAGMAGYIAFKGFQTVAALPAAVSALAKSAPAAAQATTVLGNSMTTAADAAKNLGGAMNNAGGGPGGRGGLGGFLGSISWSDVGKIAAMMVILAGGLYLLGKALTTFNDVEWSSLGKAAAALGGFMALGALLVIFKPLAAGLLVLAGAAAVVGAALMMAGKGIQLIISGFADLERARTERMQKIPEAMASIAMSSKQLKEMNSRDVTKNVDAITDSLVKLSKTSAGSKFSNDNIFNKLLQLAGAAGNLQSISNSLQNIQSVSESMTKSISEKINSSVNVIATTSIEVKNLNELKETVDKLISAISALGGAAGGATPVVNVTTNTAATVEKLTELITLLKEGKINARVDLDKLNTALNGKNVPAGR